jgi:hypothetical protein
MSQHLECFADTGEREVSKQQSMQDKINFGERPYKIVTVKIPKGTMFYSKTRTLGGTVKFRLESSKSGNNFNVEKMDDDTIDVAPVS